MSEINWKVGYEVKCKELTKKEKELHNLELDIQSLQAELEQLREAITDVTATTADWKAQYTNKPTSSYVQGQIDVLRSIEEMFKRLISQSK